MDRTQTYEERHPLPVLAARVRTVWIQRTGRHPVVQRHHPTGGVELHCELGTGIRLVGPLTTSLVEYLPAGTTIVGARLQPAVAGPLLSLPVDELIDHVVPLAALPHAMPHISASLAESLDPDAALAVLQQDLVRMQARLPAPDRLVGEAVRRLMPWEPAKIRSLTQDLGISESQLRRRFRAEVGITPKPLQRILRFQGYLALAQAATHGTRVADLAAEAGYADHAHLARECLRLTGQTPREVLGGAEDRCGCGHDHAASYEPFLAGRRGHVQREAHVLVKSALGPVT